MKQLFPPSSWRAAWPPPRRNAACPYPVAPGKFPDGSVATKEEMLAAKHQVVKYNADIDAYLGCIKTEYDAKVAASVDATAGAEGQDGERTGRETQRRGQGSDRRD